MNSLQIDLPSYIDYAIRVRQINTLFMGIVTATDPLTVQDLLDSNIVVTNVRHCFDPHFKAPIAIGTAVLIGCLKHDSSKIDADAPVTTIPNSARRYSYSDAILISQLTSSTYPTDIDIGMDIPLPINIGTDSQIKLNAASLGAVVSTTEFIPHATKPNVYVVDPSTLSTKVFI